MTGAQSLALFKTVTIESARDAIRCYFEPITISVAYLKKKFALLRQRRDQSKKRKALTRSLAP
jgi:hypothetical protein